MRLRPLICLRIIATAVFREASIKGLTLQYSVGVAKLSVERDFLVLRVYDWGRITVRYTEYRGVRYSGVSNVDY